MTDAAAGRWPAATGLVLFAAIGMLIGADMIADYRSGMPWTHILTEAFILLLAAAGMCVLWLRLAAAREATLSLERDLEAAREQARRWRGESQHLIRGLGEAIDRQFERWKLTPAEAEIGLLLLKGLTHKEIARACETSERTVRQQARGLYYKGGLAGRSELAAFFLEDLLLPRTQPSGDE